jgi:hypothetical protein
VLDTYANSSELEALRQAVQRNPLARLSIHVSDAARWVDGWQSGEVLRFPYVDPRAEAHLRSVISMLVQRGVPTEQAATMAGHNTSRGLIELICTNARAMGYEALAGAEVG